MTIALSDWQKKMQYTLLFIFFIQGVFYTGFLPLWEGFDEPAHFAYIQHIAENEEIPVLGKSFISQEVIFSIISLPINYNLYNGLHWNNSLKLIDWTSYSKYWSSPVTASKNEYDKIISLPISTRLKPSTNPHMGIWEAQQAPLYYFLSTPIYFLFYNSDLFVRVFILRLFSVILVTIALFVLFKTVCELFDDFFMQFGTLIFFALTPMFAVTVARVGNQSLTILFFSLFFYLAVKFLKNDLNAKLSALLGLVIGFGLLTRASFFIALVLTCILFIFKYLQKEYRFSKVFKHSGLTFGMAFLVSGWWYIKNLILDNNLSGISGIPTASFSELYRVGLSIGWIFYFKEVFLNYWGLFGWSFIRLPKIYYIFAIIISIISIYGLLKPIILNRKNIFVTLKSWQVQSLFIFAISILLIIAGLAYVNIKYYLVYSMSVFTGGYYLYELSIANAVLLLFGLRTFIPIGYRTKLIFVFFIAMSIFNFVVLFYYLIPAYYW